MHTLFDSHSLALASNGRASKSRKAANQWTAIFQYFLTDPPNRELPGSQETRIRDRDQPILIRPINSKAMESGSGTLSAISICCAARS